MRTRWARHFAVAVGIVVVTAAGCGDGHAPTRDFQPTPEPEPEETTSGTSPAPDDERVRATGVVVEGVEPGCLLLDTGETRYLLLDGDRDRLEPRQRVTVSGIADPGMPTTCMEGVPLTVTEITPAG